MRWVGGRCRPNQQTPQDAAARQVGHQAAPWHAGHLPAEQVLAKGRVSRYSQLGLSGAWGAPTLPWVPSSKQISSLAAESFSLQGERLSNFFN